MSPMLFSNLAGFIDHLVILFFVKITNESIFVMENKMYQSKSVVLDAFGPCLPAMQNVFFFK